MILQAMAANAASHCRAGGLNSSFGMYRSSVWHVFSMTCKSRSVMVYAFVHMMTVATIFVCNCVSVY